MTIKAVRHGLHVDHFWPTAIESIWRKGPITLRRFRLYRRYLHQDLKRTTWSLEFERNHG